MVAHILLYLSRFLLAVVLLKVLALVSLSYRHHRAHQANQQGASEGVNRGYPLASILVPCYDEEITVGHCVQSLLRQRYPNFEIILIDDGRRDRTPQMIRELARRYDTVRAYRKANGGKGSALNYGIARARGGIIVCTDADSMLLPDALAQLVMSLQQSGVSAVGGNVRVANRTRSIGRYQAIEYITGLTIQRRAFAQLGCMQVISGALGAFRKSDLIEIGGYSTDTIVEDMDITLELAKRGKKIVYNPLAIAYTEAPESVRDFLKQRLRWTSGGFQVIAKHKEIIFRRRQGRMGTIGIPYFLIFPWIDVLVSLLLAFSVVRAVLTDDVSSLLTVLLVMGAIQATVILYAVILDHEDKGLVFRALIDGLFFGQLVSYSVLKAGATYVLGGDVCWNKLCRHGRNSLRTVRYQSAVAPLAPIALPWAARRHLWTRPEGQHFQRSGNHRTYDARHEARSRSVPV
jgi:peptidoglycan-N-acetylglucosamine deacetylase